MAWYAKSSWRLTRQVVADAVGVGVALGSYLVGRTVYQAIYALRDPVSSTAASMDSLRQRMGEAAHTAGQIPIAGSSLSAPLTDMSTQLGNLTTVVSDQVGLVERVAGIAGMVVFLVPVVIWLLIWLPMRVRYARESAAANRMLANGVGLDIFALRGLTRLSMRTLASVSGDPAKAWREGDTEVIASLGRLELDRLGIKAPAGL